MQSTCRNYIVPTLCRVHLLETFTILKPFPNVNVLVFLPHTFLHALELCTSKKILVLMEKSFLRTEKSFLGGVSNGDINLISCIYHQTAFLFAAKTHLCCFPITDIVVLLPLNSDSWEKWWASGFLNAAWTDPWQGALVKCTHEQINAEGVSLDRWAFSHPRAFGGTL